MPDLFWWAVFFLGGLVFGSFANVCIWRIPRGEEIVRTPSHCPNCGSDISWFDNIPLISYLSLGGRCRGCRKPISLRYPLVEFICGILFLATFLGFGISWALPGYLYFTWALLVVSVVDLMKSEIPHKVTIPGILIGFIYAFLSSLGMAPNLSALGFMNDLWYGPLADSILGAFSGGGILFTIGFLWKKIKNVEAMGFGDVMLMTMVGAFLGWKAILVTLFLSSFGGTLAGVILIITDALKRKIMPEKVGDGQSIILLEDGKATTFKSYIKYGPFIAAGALATMFFGDKLLYWYISLLSGG